MKVPIRLRRVTRSGSDLPVTGLLFHGPAGDLLGLCARLQEFPPLFAVPGGFLIVLSRPVEGVIPGVIRLRSLAPHLFLPADADLEPTLLEDEASALTRDQGLVFLPGDRVLGFDPKHPLRLSDLVRVARPTRNHAGRRWQPLPTGPVYADHLGEVTFDRPGETVEGVLNPGGQDLARELPRPADTHPVTRIVGETAAGAGKGLMWLGNLLGWRSLAQLGARLIHEAVRQVPRVSESLLGQQEAALRELLRKFRTGNLEEALRHALPLGGPASRGGSAAQDSRLPFHNLLYSLHDLLGADRGTPSVWMGGNNLHTELEAEYRKAAESATREGDYRRAAFIYGKLLRDYRLAADVLSRGGLHHDAAILYLEKLGDALAAARAFEAAGEMDRALDLYHQRNEYVLAGDLLRRAGETERALHEYRIAAARLVAEHNHHAAGELLLTRANRADLALDCFVSGWSGRPHGSALACLHRLTALYGEQPTPEQLWQLLDEADELFGRPGLESHAARFYNTVAQLATRNRGEAWQAGRDDLDDRALLGLAAKLRQRSSSQDRPGDAISTLFGHSGAWPAALVRDAEHAHRSALKSRTGPKVALGMQRVATLRGQVTAVCAAQATGDLFIGFHSGALVGFQPIGGAQPSFPSYFWPVSSLATDTHGDRLLILRDTGEGFPHLHGYRRLEDASYQPTVWRTLSPIGSAELPPGARLTPISVEKGIPWAGLWDGQSLTLLEGDDFLPKGRLDLPVYAADYTTAFFLSAGTAARSLFDCVLLCGNTLCFADPPQPNWDPDQFPDTTTFTVPWTAAVPDDCFVNFPVLSWLAPHPTHLELAGVDAEGVLYLSLFTLSTKVEGGPRAHTVRAFDRRYRVATLIRPGRLAGVAANGVAWLAGTGSKLVATDWTPGELSDAIAAFASPVTNELIVVCREGDVVRVPIPN